MPYRRTVSRIQHSEEVRAGIIAAALGIIANDGVEALSIRRIAAHAGTSTGNFYFHFRNKDDLLLAIVEELVSRAAHAIDQAGARADDEPHRLARMVYTGVRAILADRSLGSALFGGALGVSVRARIAEAFVERTKTYFMSPQADQSRFSSLNPGLVAHLWQGAILLTVERVLAGELALTDDETASGCAMWNLTALGYDPATIGDAIKAARRAHRKAAAAGPGNLRTRPPQ